MAARGVLRAVVTVVALAYTLAGVGALLVAFVLPSADPLSAVLAITLGLPWTLALQGFEPAPDGAPVASIALVAAAVALNAGLLWWLAGRLAARRRAAEEVS